MAGFWLVMAGVNGVLAVGAGALAAHGGGTQPLLETAAHYQLAHAPALALSAVLPGPWAQLAGWAFLAGCVLFSGLLYARALADINLPGVPIGGAAFMLGWSSLAVAGLRRLAP